MQNKWNVTALSHLTRQVIYDRRCSRHHWLKGHCPKGQLGGVTI
jgi:hypothetical protein